MTSQCGPQISDASARAFGILLRHMQRIATPRDDRSQPAGSPARIVNTCKAEPCTMVTSGHHGLILISMHLNMSCVRSIEST